MPRPAFLVACLALPLTASVAISATRENLTAVFVDQVAKCYTPPAKAANQKPAVIEVHLNQDGSLAHPPKVLDGSPASAAAVAVLQAVERCTPFQIPATIVPRYAQWKVIQIRFETIP